MLFDSEGFLLWNFFGFFSTFFGFECFSISFFASMFIRATNGYDPAKCLEDSLSNHNNIFQDSLQSVDAEFWLTKLMISICIVLRFPEYALVAGKWEDLLFAALLVSCRS